VQHDVVPRFSIHNVFAMKEEMDATEWGDKIKATVQDWAVPDVSAIPGGRGVSG
jgi:hypothetical protein